MVVIGIVCLATLGIVFAIMPGPAHSSIFRAGDATEDDARLLREVLETVGYVGGEKDPPVGISARAGRYTISFGVAENAWDDPETVQRFERMGAILADTRFGRPLTIALCSEGFESRKQITIR